MSRRERVRATNLVPRANPKRDGIFLILAAIALAGLLAYKMHMGEKTAHFMEWLAPSETLPQTALDSDAGRENRTEEEKDVEN